MFVGAADVDGDGYADLMTGSGTGGVGRLQIYSGRDLTLSGSLTTLADLTPFGPGFSGEVRVAGADLDGDGRAEIIAGEGAGGASLVNVFDGQNLALLTSFQPYGPTNATGVFVGAVPEPGTWTLLLLGAGAGGALGTVRRRRTRGMPSFFTTVAAPAPTFR